MDRVRTSWMYMYRAKLLLLNYATISCNCNQPNLLPSWSRHYISRDERIGGSMHCTFFALLCFYLLCFSFPHPTWDLVSNMYVLMLCVDCMHRYIPRRNRVKSNNSLTGNKQNAFVAYDTHENTFHMDMPFLTFITKWTYPNPNPNPNLTWMLSAVIYLDVPSRTYGLSRIVLE